MGEREPEDEDEKRCMRVARSSDDVTEKSMSPEEGEREADGEKSELEQQIRPGFWQNRLSSERENPAVAPGKSMRSYQQGARAMQTLAW